MHACVCTSSQPRQNDPLLISERAIVVEGLEGLGRRVAEGFGTKVELTLLERHEAGCCEESTPVFNTQHRNQCCFQHTTQKSVLFLTHNT